MRRKQLFLATKMKMEYLDLQQPLRNYKTINTMVCYVWQNSQPAAFKIPSCEKEAQLVLIQVAADWVFSCSVAQSMPNRTY